MISIQYAAGFFDGEGSVTVNLYWPKDGGLPIPHVRAAVSNYIEEPIRLIIARWGGSINKSKGDIWSANLNGVHAQQFLRDVRPYLIVKYDAACAALRLFDVHDDVVERLMCAKAIMDATRKGYKAVRSDITYKAIVAALNSVDNK